MAFYIPNLPHFLTINWLQVLGTAERTQIYQRVRHEFHAVVSLLDAFKAEQQPLELVVAGQGPLNAQAYGTHGGGGGALAAAVRRRATTRILLDGRDHAGVESTLAVG